VTTAVSEYGDIEADGGDFTISDRDAVARCLQTCGKGHKQLIAYVPGWLADEKGIDTVVDEIIKHETENAYLVVIGGNDVWLPKSVITRFVPAAGATISIPQRGLGEFAGGESA